MQMRDYPKPSTAESHADGGKVWEMPGRYSSEPSRFRQAMGRQPRRGREAAGSWTRVGISPDKGSAPSLFVLTKNRGR